jgi:phage repressor protein C with HTH and peptisase S24 domain
MVMVCSFSPTHLIGKFLSLKNFLLGKEKSYHYRKKMTDARTMLETLIRERGDDYVSLSRLIGRNAAYIQQFLHRGSPKKLDEEDRRTLAQYFGVDEQVLGGPPAARPILSDTARKKGVRSAFVLVPRLSVGASAGPGTVVGDEARGPSFGFETKWLQAVSSSPDQVSMIQVSGDSMAPTLIHGDDIMVDRSDAEAQLRDGIYVLRFDDVLMVKRLVLHPGRARMSMRSDNSDYPNWEDCDPASITVIGRVIWIGRKI